MIVATRVCVVFVHRKVETHSLVQNYDCYYLCPLSFCPSHSCEPFVTAHVYVVLSPHQIVMAHTRSTVSSLQLSMNVVVVRTVHCLIILLLLKVNTFLCVLLCFIGYR